MHLCSRRRYLHTSRLDAYAKYGERRCRSLLRRNNWDHDEGTHSQDKRAGQRLLTKESFSWRLSFEGDFPTTPSGMCGRRGRGGYIKVSKVLYVACRQSSEKRTALSMVPPITGGWTLSDTSSKMDGLRGRLNQGFGSFVRCLPTNERKAYYAFDGASHQRGMDKSEKRIALSNVPPIKRG